MNKIIQFSCLLLICVGISLKIPIVFASDFIADFGALEGNIKYYGSGYEFAFGEQYPLDQMIKPLKPQIFRTFNFWMTKKAYDRVIAIGATPNVALTDGKCNYSPWPGDGGPYEPFATNWIACIKSKVQEAKADGMISKEWEIWAEPDLPPANAAGYWPNAPYPTADFLNLWDRAYQAIKSVDSTAKVVGPSTFEYKPMYMIDFLKHTKEAGTVPDVLAWHELYNVFNTVNNFIPAHITEHATHARQVMINSSIPDATTKKIEITEYMGLEDQYRPGIAVQFFANFEISKIYGIKGNWVPNHYDNLNELIATPQSTTARSIWWAYKSYADMTGLLATRNVAGIVDGLATIDSQTKKAYILVGNIGDTADRTVQAIRLPTYLQNAEKEITVAISRIPNTEAADLSAPITIANYLAKPTNGTLEFALPNFGKFDAYFIVLSRPGNSSIPTPSPSQEQTRDSYSIGVQEFNVLRANYGKQVKPEFASVDFDNNGIISIFDYNLLIQYYGQNRTN